MPFDKEDILDGDCSRGKEKQENDATEKELMGEMTEEDKEAIEKKRKEAERYNRGSDMAMEYGRTRCDAQKFFLNIGEKLSRLRGIADPNESMSGYYGREFEFRLEMAGIDTKKINDWGKVGDVYQELVDGVTRQYPQGKENYKTHLQELQEKEAEAKGKTIKGRASSAVQSARKSLGI